MSFMTLHFKELKLCAAAGGLGFSCQRLMFVRGCLCLFGRLGKVNRRSCVKCYGCVDADWLVEQYPPSPDVRVYVWMSVCICVHVCVDVCLDADWLV